MLWTGQPAETYTIERQEGGKWLPDPVFTDFTSRRQAVAVRKDMLRRQPLAMRRVVGTLPMNQVGRRVTHDHKLNSPMCNGPSHRTGVLTGKTFVEEFNGEIRERAEVTWDCGHVRIPLVSLLREAD